jgi:hypothetical protein
MTDFLGTAWICRAYSESVERRTMIRSVLNLEHDIGLWALEKTEFVAYRLYFWCKNSDYETGEVVNDLYSKTMVNWDLSLLCRHLRFSKLCKAFFCSDF